MAGLIYYDYSQREPLSYAAAVLGVEKGQLYSCPRFLYPSEEGVEEIRKIVNALMTVEGEMRVVYFGDADLLNVSCQNALLKTVEDRDDVLVIFVGTKKLLDTIESRCLIYRARIPGREEFYSEIKSSCEQHPWLYAFAKGHADVGAEVVKDARLCGILDKLQNYRGPESMDKADLFTLFNMMKEKDSECFFEKYRSYIPNMYGMIASLIIKAIAAVPTKRRYELEDFLGVVSAHLRRVRASKSYSRNDFFEILARM